MSSPRDRGGIFISYRREETAAQAGRLYDRLSDRFGEDRVFMDVDSIAIGVDFTEAIIEAVSKCDILLALIGRDWLVIVDSKGVRRLDNPDDFVRVEIETALQRGIRVVPVLVDEASLPQASDLPPTLQPLTRRQALGLSHAGFRSEVARLVAAVDEVFGTVPGPTARPAAPRGMQFGGGQPGDQRQQPGTVRPAPQPRTFQVGQWVYKMTFSPDSTWLVTGSRQRVRIWDLETGAKVRELQFGGLTDPVQAVAFSPDGSRLATGSFDKTARIWDARTGEQQLQLTHDSTVSRIAFSPDGTRLATGSTDKTVRIWDAHTGQQQLQLTHDSYGRIAFSPDGTWLASGSGKTVRIWDARTGEQQFQATHDGTVAAVAFSPDGTGLVTAGTDKTVRTWDARTGQLRQFRIDHGGRIDIMELNADCTRLATGRNFNKMVQVWDASGLQQFQVVHGGWVYAVTFSPDGAWLATGGTDSTAQVWNVAGR